MRLRFDSARLPERVLLHVSILVLFGPLTDAVGQTVDSKPMPAVYLEDPNYLKDAKPLTFDGSLASDPNNIYWDDQFNRPGVGPQPKNFPRIYALGAGGGMLYVGGRFEVPIGNRSQHSIAAWDGFSWNALGNDQGPHLVHSLAVEGTTVFAGGFYGFIKEWNGNRWSEVGGGLDGPDRPKEGVFPNVWATAAAGGRLYVGGTNITLAGNVCVSNIAMWDGAQWSPMMGGVSGGVWAISVHGNDVYVGGGVDEAGGLTFNNIAK